jgi:hypothetical protein
MRIIIWRKGWLTHPWDPNYIIGKPFHKLPLDKNTMFEEGSIDPSLSTLFTRLQWWRKGQSIVILTCPSMITLILRKGWKKIL